MTKRLWTSLILLGFAINNLNGQATTVRTYYLQGQQYRTGNGVAIDYTKAYELFSKSAGLGDQRGEYAQAYMLYKGLGCTQDYTKAASIFQSLAYQGYDNSMYFYGLCLRNGYGVDYNKDSAVYWLKKADSLGSTQARLELSVLVGENGDDAARQLVERIHNEALPKSSNNKFIRIPQKMPFGAAIDGKYAGWLLQYDWSGQNVVSAKRLEVALTNEGGKITGRWAEEGADTIDLSAIASGDSLRFADMGYRRHDHYSAAEGTEYRLTNASLSIVQGMDSVYLAGNVTMYSPERKEPSKPVVIALARATENAAGQVENLKAGPNPFTGVLHVTFNMTTSAGVWLALTDIGGRTVYTKDGGQLQGGTYSFDLLPGNLAAGAYVLQVKAGSKLYKIKVIRGK